MKKFFLTTSSLIFVLIIGSNLQNLQSKSNGSIIGYAGAPKAGGGFELTCTNCHGGTANTGPNSVNISVNGNPAGYEAGQSYSITAKIVNPTGVRAGFSLVCLDPTLANCGTFTVGTGTRIVSNASTGRFYINHSGTSLKSWTFTWTAPTANIPDSVTFYMASMEVTGGDRVYTGKLVFRKQTASLAVMGNTSVAALGTSSASISSSISSDGGQSISQRGVCWSQSPSPTISLNTKTSDGSGTGNFTSSLSGLSPSTTYFLRSYAVNSVGTSYGQEITFTTLACTQAQISGPVLVTCAVPEITLTATGSGDFLWNTGATGSSITISPEVSGLYSVIVSGGGCLDTAYLSVNVDKTSPPVPAITAPSVAFCAKTQAVQSSAPSGNQWLLNGLPLSGALAPLYWPLQSGSYSVSVTNPLNGCSSVAQVPVLLNVLPLPVISQQPESVSVPAGASARFVLVTEGSGNVFRWQSSSSGSFSDLSASTGVSGVNNDTLSITAEASLNGTQFRCIVSDGTCQDTSTAVSLSVVTANKSRLARFIEIQPNPAKSFIRFSGTSGQVSYKISGSDGRLLLSGNAQENTDIPLQGLAPGCYFWQASGSSGKKEFGRFILEP